VKALDGLFHIIDSTTDRIVLITDKVVEGLTSLVTSIFTSKKKNEKKEVEQKESKKKWVKEDFALF